MAGSTPGFRAVEARCCLLPMQAVTSGTRASSDPARHAISGLAPRSPGQFSPNSSLVASPVAPAVDYTPDSHAVSDPALQRGWAGAEGSLSPPEALGYGGYRLSSAAAPFSPSHVGYGIDPGAVRRGVQVRERGARQLPAGYASIRGVCCRGDATSVASAGAWRASDSTKMRLCAVHPQGKNNNNLGSVRVRVRVSGFH